VDAHASEVYSTGVESHNYKLIGVFESRFWLFGFCARVATIVDDMVRLVESFSATR
jgi:hypothetical protein